MSDEVNMFKQPYRPMKDMARQELETELASWRNLWTWNEESLQYWLSKVGNPVRLTLRNYSVVEGRLGQPHFELKSIDVDWVERVYNYSRQEASYYTQTSTYPLSQLVSFALVLDKEVIAENSNPTPIDEAVNKLDLSKELEEV